MRSKVFVRPHADLGKLEFWGFVCKEVYMNPNRLSLAGELMLAAGLHEKSHPCYNTPVQRISPWGLETSLGGADYFNNML